MTRVTGVAELRRRWLAIPGRVRAAVKAEMEKQATAIVADMKAAAPQGLTGELRESIGWTWGNAPSGAMTIGQLKGSDGGSKSLRITIYAGGTPGTERTQRRASGSRARDQNRTGSWTGGRADVAVYQEFGTANMAANPFFFPVWRARRTAAKRAISAAMRKAVRAG